MSMSSKMEHLEHRAMNMNMMGYEAVRKMLVLREAQYTFMRQHFALFHGYESESDSEESSNEKQTRFCSCMHVTTNSAMQVFLQQAQSLPRRAHPILCVFCFALFVLFCNA